MIIPCSYIRGGTSRALFFQKKDLPEDQSLWPEIFMMALGIRRTPTGLSAMGADFPTRKVAVISPSERPDADVDYNFFQIDPAFFTVDNRGNCGNMSSAVGPFAVDAGLVQAEGDRAEVRIFNTNTRRIITSRFLLKDGKAAVEGDAEIYGVPGTGSPIWLSFERPGGGRTEKLFPTGNRIDIFDIPDFGPLPVTVIDCANPVVLFRAADLGLTGCELSELHKDRRIMEIIETVRGKAAEIYGLVDNWRDAAHSSTYIPFVGMVSAPQDYYNMDGEAVSADSMDICCRAFVQKMHRAYPMAAGIATAAAAKISGTVASEVLRPGHTGEKVILGHAGGTTEVQLQLDENEDVVHGTILRTANMLFHGNLHLPECKNEKIVFFK